MPSRCVSFFSFCVRSNAGKMELLSGKEFVFVTVDPCGNSRIVNGETLNVNVWCKRKDWFYCPF